MSAPSKRIYSSDSRSDKLILSAISPTPGQRLQPLPPSSEPFGIPIQNSYSQNFPRRQAFSIDPVGCISPHSFGEQESTITVGEYSEHTAFTPSNELDLQLMNIDSTMSPSSDVTSPMDLCFANIIDEQSNDDNDLNNITPSIKFASSLTPLDSRDLPSGRNDTPSSSSIGRVVGVRRPARPLVKSDKMSSLSAAGIPGAGSGGGVGAAVGSCPDSFIDRRPTSLSYPLPALSYGSPTGDAGPPTAALAAPQTTCGSISSGNGTWTGGSNITSPSGDIGLMPASMGNDTQRVAMMRARNKKDSHNRKDKAVIFRIIGIADHLGHQHVLSISPPDENIVQQLPAPRSRVHPRGLLPRRKAECVDQQETMFRTGSEKEAVIVTATETVGTQHSLPGSVAPPDVGVEVTKDN
ncbi:unnamed protein product [Schistocephalus solidus]|uniref:Uncharacterized protein n=1 Tax=Schistocephalus solidus TaxID=70667 RepID=A0A183SMU2_SCHSO|nr:unnamed protein product [Schistocephalus solidus]